MWRPVRYAVSLACGLVYRLNLSRKIDAFWGYGADKQGKNELGKALVRLREKLRANPGFYADREHSEAYCPACNDKGEHEGTG